MDDKYIGATLEGRYRIDEVLGEGGMANVYKGTDLRDQRVVAIKILKDEFNDNAELVRRFKNESRAISVLNHPNIVKVYDIGMSSPEQYIVMEYIDGITLKTYIEQRGEPLTYKETLHFVAQVLRALQHAHDKGIVHRDIKPQNIMLLEDGTVKVMDFGIARLSRSESHTATDQAIGSVHYISPEQAKGDLTDPRADLYSLGITMYEMLSATLPFEDDNAVSIALKQIEVEATPLRQVNPSVPPGLADITMHAMEKDPRRRYQNALDMLRDLEEFKRNPNMRFDYSERDEATRRIESVGAGAKKPSANGRGPAKGGKKSKKKRNLLIPIVGGVTFVVVAVCAILCINIFQSSGTPLFGDVKEIELPNLVGMSVEEAQALLQQEEYKNLRLQEPTYEYREGVEGGEILSQNPTAPKQVKENQKIYIVVSRGIQNVEVPDLTGQNRAEATDAILALGVRPYVRSIVNDSVPVGRVISTDPAAGSTIANDPTFIVTIYISSTPKDIERTVPDLIGSESQAEAKKVLEEYNLQIGVVQEENSDAPVGSVIKQYPEPGAKVDVFSSVHITISLGPAAPEPVMVTVPNFSGMTMGEAGAAAAAAGVNVADGGSTPSDTVQAGKIVSQSVGAGSSVEEGTTVTVVVSSGPAGGASSSAPTSTPPPASTPPASTEPPSTPPPTSAMFTVPQWYKRWI